MYICTTVYLSNSRCWPRWIHVYGLIQNKYRGPCHVLRFELIWIKKNFFQWFHQWPSPWFRRSVPRHHRDPVPTHQERVGHCCPLHRGGGALHRPTPHPTPGATGQEHEYGTEESSATEDSEPSRPHG